MTKPNSDLPADLQVAVGLEIVLLTKAGVTADEQTWDSTHGGLLSLSGAKKIARLSKRDQAMLRALARYIRTGLCCDRCAVIISGTVH